MAAIAAALALPSPAGAAGLPVGDARTVTGFPAKGELRSCAPTRNRRGGRLPWVSRGRWYPKRKPMIDGRISWPEGDFTLEGLGGGAQALRSRSVPEGGATGAWPVARSDDAYRRTPKNRAIDTYALAGALPNRRPRKAACVDLNQPIGIARGGVLILPPTNRRGIDLVAREIGDRCGGVVTRKGLYGYRALPRCRAPESKRGHSAHVGWARDGFLIFGPRGHRGRKLRSSRLDRCHGHSHRLGPAGSPRRYHYHLTLDFPYAVGCFRGKPARWSRVRDPLPAESAIDVGAGQFPDPFSSGIADSVMRCNGTDPVTVEVTGGLGSHHTIDGSKPLAGRFRREVALGHGEAFTAEINRATRSSAHHFRCLPNGFPQWSYARPGVPRQAFYGLTPSFGANSSNVASLFDDHGVPVWWYQPDSTPADLRVLPGGVVAFARTSGAGYELRGLDGTLLRTISYSGHDTDFHDMQLLPNGNVLLMAYVTRDGADLSGIGLGSGVSVYDAELQEQSPDGTVVWTWNSSEHIEPSETGRWYQRAILNVPPYDLVHINSVEQAGSSRIVSMRHNDAIYSIEIATGEIEWKLGGETTPESLTVIGDPHGDFPLGGQHDARILADGTLTVYDNATDLDRPPRLVRYSIDEAAGTATLLESYEEPEVPVSFCCGSTRRAADGSWVTGWGGTPLTTEIDAAGTRTFRLMFETGVFSYRTTPVPAGAVSTAALRAGMDAQYPRG